MTFASPLLLWLLVPLALVALGRAWLRSRPARLAIADISSAEAAASPTWRTRTRWAPAALRWAAIAVLVLAVARPREGVAVALIPQEGIDVVAAVDVSSSMDTRMSFNGPTRLQAARIVLAEFVGTLQGDRVGIVAFRSSALTLSPLTHDYEALLRRIIDLDDSHLQDGTAIGLGMIEAIDLLRDSPARSRVVVLLTDGRNRDGTLEPAVATQVAATLGVRLYTIGFLGGPQDFGASEVNERLLTRLSESTGGRFFDARTPEELSDAYETIGELERSLVAEREFTSFNEFAPWLVGLAIVLLGLEAGSRALIWRRYP